jgi:hypothetical protein
MTLTFSGLSLAWQPEARWGIKDVVPGAARGVPFLRG